jgi:hypothetical protein
MPTLGNGLISVPNLMAYMSKLLPLLTQDNGERIASMEVRFQNALFVSEYRARPRIRGDPQSASGRL